MTDPLTPRPEPDDISRRLRVLRLKLWVGLILAILSLSFAFYWLAPFALKFPAASLPAILGAFFGYYRAGRKGIRMNTFPSPPNDMGVHGYTAVWGMVVGATGYALLATAGIGVPTPEAPLGWRIMGGIVFGAAAGAGAGVFLPLFISIYQLLAASWRMKRAA